MNRCGICTGGVRLYTGTLNNRPITDWKHTDVPPGTAPHRPVLGTPVDEETLERLRQMVRPVKKGGIKPPEPPPGPPIWAPRPAEPDETPKTLQGMRELAEAYGWELEWPTYFRTAKEVDYTILRGRRADLAFVACWKDGKFEEGYTLARRRADRVGSNSIKDWIRQRDEQCASCGRSSLTHNDEECDA